MRYPFYSINAAFKAKNLEAETKMIDTLNGLANSRAAGYGKLGKDVDITWCLTRKSQIFRIYSRIKNIKGVKIEMRRFGREQVYKILPNGSSMRVPVRT